ncbi:TadE/TadG family type IV pilus assembly protein [Bosea sp. TAF32]|uniref:TadE/TadG family type IV pilus assembly protein n=1 Tax=Bosea sp. TAF32 TaxID=3237482 RepID=UPI003F93A4BC
MMRFGAKTSSAESLSLWRRFCGNHGGVAAVEFAMALPVILVAYVGMVNIAQMVMVNRKMTQLTSTLSDLTARLPTVSTSEIGNIFNAAMTVLLPYDGQKAKMVIASIVIDANSIARVCWASSYPLGTSMPARGDTVTVPASARVANTSVIMAQASYAFTLPVSDKVFEFFGGKATNGAVTLGGNPIYTRPRNGRPAGDNSIEQIVRSDVTGCPKFN